MFESLIGFIEDTLFQRISRILQEEQRAAVKVHNILLLLLTFADRNPGLTRLLTSEALTGETERLRERITQFFSRLEAQIKQILREAQIRENLKPTISPAALANLLLACCEGKLQQFVRSEFKQSPVESWDVQWEFLSRDMLRPFTAIQSP